MLTEQSEPDNLSSVRVSLWIIHRCLIHAADKKKKNQNQLSLMHHLTVKTWTSDSLTCVWSSRQAFQPKQGTVICLALFHTERMRRRRRSIHWRRIHFERRPEHLLDILWLWYVLGGWNSPLNSPWLSSALRGWETLKEEKHKIKLHRGSQLTSCHHLSNYSAVIYCSGPPIH